MSHPSWAELAFADLDLELASLRKTLERLPEDRFGWKPHEKSFTLIGLAAHTSDILFWAVSTLTTDEFDLAKPFDPPPAPATRDELLEAFDDRVRVLKATMEKTPESAYFETWTFRNGDQVAFAQPRAVVLRRFCFNHMAHHRAQLGVYLRLLDVPVPATFGRSADEMG